MANVSVLDRRLTDPNMVFGFKDNEGTPFERDPKTKRPIEHGIGSPGHETQQHYQAIIKYSPDPKAREAAQIALDKLLKGAPFPAEPDDKF